MKIFPYKKNILTVIIFSTLLVVIAFIFSKSNKPNSAIKNNIDTEKQITCGVSEKSFKIKNISFKLNSCDPQTSNDPRSYYEDSTGNIFIKNNLSPDKDFLAVEVLEKKLNETPLEFIKRNYFDKLNQKQQELCEMQEIGTTKENTMREDLRKAIHKTRYQIVPKKEVVKMLIDKYDGLAPNDEQDYICGKLVGSPLDVSSPYFEFDDRSPSKYLFIHLTWNDDGPNIDLSSFKF